MSLLILESMSTRIKYEFNQYFTDSDFEEIIEREFVNANEAREKYSDLFKIQVRKIDINSEKDKIINNRIHEKKQEIRTFFDKLIEDGNR